MKLIKFIQDLIFLVVYFHLKKRGFVTDVYYDSWNTLRESDIGTYKIYLKLLNGHTARFTLYDIDKTGYMPKGIYFDLEFIDDLPYIRDCTFLEFYKLYKDTILFIANNEEVIDNGQDTYR